MIDERARCRCGHRLYDHLGPRGRCNEGSKQCRCGAFNADSRWNDDVEAQEQSVDAEQKLNYLNLAKLREPFPPEQIGKLPKGGIQLDFVGHGFITQRLLDVDLTWNWKPVAVDEHGLPLMDEFGGLWIRLTVCGVTRLGYGDAGGRKGPNAIKESIGDALRNAGMRFGLALDLWCKGDPDAPQPPTRKEKAQNELLAVCKRKKLAPADVGQRFADEYGKTIAQADPETIEAFTKVISDE